MILTIWPTRSLPQGATFSWATWENQVRIQHLPVITSFDCEQEKPGRPLIVDSGSLLETWCFHHPHPDLDHPYSNSYHHPHQPIIFILWTSLNHQPSSSRCPPGNHWRRFRNDPRPNQGRDHHKRWEEHCSLPNWGSHQIGTRRFCLKLCCGGCEEDCDDDYEDYDDN